VEAATKPEAPGEAIDHADLSLVGSGQPITLRSARSVAYCRQCKQFKLSCHRSLVRQSKALAYHCQVRVQMNDERVELNG
jgi:hypothetical protein